MKHVAEKEGAIFLITFFLVTGSQEWSVKLDKTHSLLRQEGPFVKEYYSFNRGGFLGINASTPIILLVSEAPVIWICAGRRKPSNHY